MARQLGGYCHRRSFALLVAAKKSGRDTHMTTVAENYQSRGDSPHICQFFVAFSRPTQKGLAPTTNDIIESLHRRYATECDPPQTSWKGRLENGNRGIAAKRKRGFG